MGLSAVDCRQIPQHQHGGFIESGEVGKIACVLPSSFQDKVDLLTEADAVRKEQQRIGQRTSRTGKGKPSYRSQPASDNGSTDVHQRMWKSHFGTIDSAIASSLDDSEERSVVGIQDDAAHGVLRGSVIVNRVQIISPQLNPC